MLYPSEQQPLTNRLLHFYYNACLDRSFGPSKKSRNSLNSNEKDNHSRNQLSAGTRVF